MKKGLFEQQPETINLLTDEYEWDHVLYLIKQAIEELTIIDINITTDSNLSNNFLHSGILFLFEREMKNKLEKVGFKKNILENPDELQKVVEALDTMGIEYSSPRRELPYGYPEKVIKAREDKRIFWVEQSIESALRALKSIKTIKKELSDNKSIMLFLKSYEFFVNVFRAGCMKHIISESKKQDNRKNTMEIYGDNISLAIQKVFEKYPIHKTLGALWQHFNSVNDKGVFTNPKSRNKEKDMYKLRIETDVKTKKEVLNVYKYILNSEKELELKLLKSYKKRSLQKYIDKIT